MNVIDWGASNTWLLSGPWRKFTTKSLTYNGQGITSAAFTFVTPQQLVGLTAYNGSTPRTTVTISCPGQPTLQVIVPANTIRRITTGWTGTCTTVTLTSSNGWDTNYDDFVIRR
jgi:hypothetical protein